MEPYRYEPLNLEVPAFRLVRICRGESDDDICCELIQAWFNIPESQIPYEALSYTWGKQEKEEEIILDDQVLLVTKNLFAALLHLRREHQDRVMWIDAICIDQENEKERGHQVQQMVDIYRNAEQVVIWLGIPRWDVGVLLEIMKQVEERCSVYSSHYWESNDHRWSEFWLEAIKIAQKPEAILRSGLEVLLGRSWWRRVWILQEVANARTATILCGEYSVSARIFAIIAPLLIKAPSSHCRAVLDIFPGSIRNSSWWSQRRDLETLLDKFRESEASDSRDKIYALLGLSSDAYASPFLVADYSMNIQEVLDKTISFLVRANSIDGNTCKLSVESESRKVIAYLKDTKTVLLRNMIKERDENGARLVIETGNIDINAVNAAGHTPIYSAALLQLETVVSLLLAQDTIKPNPTDPQGRSLLSRLTEHSNTSMVALLLGHAAVDMYSRDRDGRMPLWYAIKNQDLPTARLFMELGGIKPNLFDIWCAHGSAFLHRRFSLGSKESLIERAVFDSTCGGKWIDELGRSLLSVVAETGDYVLTSILLSRQTIDINKRSHQGMTALMYAAKGGHDNVLRLLVKDDGVDVNAYDQWGLTALHFAARNNSKVAIKTLLSHKDIQVNLRDKDGRSPLSLAAEKGHTDAIQSLLLNHKDMQVNLQDKDGRSPLSLAAENGRTDAVKMLLGHEDIQVNLQDENGKSALSLAAKNGRRDVADTLLDHKNIQVNLQDKDGRCPLSLAAEWGHKETVLRLLQEDSVQADSKCHHGKTPLAYAILVFRSRDRGMDNYLDVIKMLAKRSDVDVRSVGKYINTPITFPGWLESRHRESESLRRQQILEALKTSNSY